MAIKLEPSATPRDGHPEKRFPAGLSSVMKALRLRYMIGQWERGEQGARRKALIGGDYWNDHPPTRLIEICRLVASKFTGLNPGAETRDRRLREEAELDPTKEYVRVRRTIGRNFPNRWVELEKQVTVLKYADLRVLSDFAGLSVAQFTILAHAVSTERRAFNEALPKTDEKHVREDLSHPSQYETLRQFLAEHQRLLDKMSAIVDAAEEDGRPAFYELRVGHKDEYLARADVIEDCALAVDRPDPLTGERPSEAAKRQRTDA